MTPDDVLNRDLSRHQVVMSPSDYRLVREWYARNLGEDVTKAYCPEPTRWGRLSTAKAEARLAHATLRRLRKVQRQARKKNRRARR